MTAGKIQPDFRQHLTVFRELADLGWVDLDLMGTEVAGELGGICPGDLDQMRHMTLGTGKLHAQVHGIILLPGFVWMALFAFQVYGLLASLAELNDTRVGVMAKDAFQNCMLASEEIGNFIRLDEPIFSSHGCSSMRLMAG